MRILYVTTVSSTINAFLVPHIIGLLDMGHIVECAASNNTEFNPELEERGVKFYDIPFDRSIFSVGNVGAFKEIRKLIKKEKYDIVHIHTPIASAITRLACIGLEVKVIYTAHGFHFYKGAPKKNWLLFYPVEKILSYFTDILICINKEDYLLSLSKFNKPKIVYIPGVGVDTQKFKPVNSDIKVQLRTKYGFRKDDFIIISVGELNNNKNHILTLESMKSLTSKYDNIKYLLIGDGFRRKEYEQFVEDEKMESFIKILGRRKDIPNLLQISDVLVSVSYREGLPVNVLEAKATGLTVVATDIRGNRDLVEQGKTGILINNQINKLSNAILNLYNDKELLISIGQNNIQDSRKYDLNEIMRMIMDVFD